MKTNLAKQNNEFSKNNLNILSSFFGSNSNPRYYKSKSKIIMYGDRC